MPPALSARATWGTADHGAGKSRNAASAFLPPARCSHHSSACAVTSTPCDRPTPGTQASPMQAAPQRTRHPTRHPVRRTRVGGAAAAPPARALWREGPPPPPNGAGCGARERSGARRHAPTELLRETVGAGVAAPHCDVRRHAVTLELCGRLGGRRARTGADVGRRRGNPLCHCWWPPAAHGRTGGASQRTFVARDWLYSKVCRCPVGITHRAKW